MEILKASPSNIIKVAQSIEEGAVALLPSDVAYALVCSSMLELSLKKMRKIIDVPDDYPVQAFIHPDDIDKYAYTSTLSSKIIKELLPAAMVLILRKKPNALDLLAPGLSSLGVSWNENPAVVAVYNVIKIPLAFTRAAKPGGQLSRDFASAKGFGENAVDIALDYGSCKYREGSGTILDMTSDDIKIIREGIVSVTKINELIQKYRNNEK